nr:class I SAM-dependent methyltransferase [Asticcacaulis taihuensis]
MAYLINKRGLELQGKTILHFSPEQPLFHRLKDEPGYISGDIKKNKYAHYEVDVTAIPYPDKHFDVIVCNHVMEHVPDHHKGFAECFRVLKDDGVAFFSVPFYDDREVTWYPPADMPKEEVDRICGVEHRRLYGRDFADIVAVSGFNVASEVLSGEEEALYRTDNNDPIFICTKPVID